ncbi:MAG: magnesium chelatase subunit I [Myxococcales bacterium]
MELARDRRARMIAEIKKVYIGDDGVVDVLLTALLGRGHALLEGVPGIAKTTLVKAFARTLGLTFRRVQFTPDLLPADITGTYVLDLATNTFVLRKGPIFANVVLGDEINRAPAKTQSALLEAMQEGQVTVEGDTRPLDPPFMVLATQNPVEQEGVYPLPEAQVDRFMVKLELRYPTFEEEQRILTTYNHPVADVEVVLSPQEVLDLIQEAERVHIEPDLRDYVIRLARFTREHPHALLGASPRASLALMRTAKIRALLQGRDFALPDDVRFMAPFVLTHRVVLTPDAELEGVRPADVLQDALRATRYARE